MSPSVQEVAISQTSQEFLTSQNSQLALPSTSTAIISDESSDLWNADLCETSTGKK